MSMQPLKVYADRRSQPSRAVIIFCRVNQIDFEEVTVDLFKPSTSPLNSRKSTQWDKCQQLLMEDSNCFKGREIAGAVMRTIESIWLKGDAKFLYGNPQPSIADLSLVCEITQLEVIGDDRRDRILGPHEKIRTWMKNVKSATSPHFEEAHELLFKVKARLSAAHFKRASKL